MYELGFLKFLKKDKNTGLSKEFDDLDAPPAPPDASFDDGGLGKMPDLPPLPSLDEEDDFGQDALDDDSWDRPVSDIDISMGQNQEASAKRPQPKVPEIPPDLVSNVPISKPSGFGGEMQKKAPVAQHKKHPSSHHGNHPLFMKVSTFKGTIRDIQSLKGSLKQANFSMQTVTSLDDSLGKRMYKWRAQMLDLQKKLMFVEQTIFKR